MVSGPAFGRRLGMLGAALYTVLTALLLGYTWHNTKPEYHGFDWFWACVLTLPWSAIVDSCHVVSLPAAVIIGIGLNAGVIYLFGRLLT